VKTEHQVSAGGVVVRAGEVLLISTFGGRRWQLPKGHLEAGESPEQAAVREVEEETGVRGRVLAELPDVEYWFTERGTHRIHKRVYYYLLVYERGDTADYDPHEVSGAAWMSWEEALARLSFANDRRVVKRARQTVGESFPDLDRA
jgi:8-oxo-dGTP pyrophosphatase MutT (NUDIX family)